MKAHCSHRFSFPGILATPFLPFLRVSRFLFLFLLTGFISRFAPSTASAAPSLEKWIYCSRNLWVDDNVAQLTNLFARAAAAGYTHVLLSDSKFAKLGDMDARYFRNIKRTQEAAMASHLEIVPALFPVGYSNDILWHDPNLVEALPVTNVLFVVHDGVARLPPGTGTRIKGGDFADLKQWDWRDDTLTAQGGAALITDPRGKNARIAQKIKLTPFRQYHFSLRVKTLEFRGTPEIKILAGKRSLDHNALGVKRTQDWMTHHVVFNSLDNAEATLYAGAWGAETGSLWFDDAALEEVALVNLVRRDGTPFILRKEDGTILTEGRDFEKVIDLKMGRRLWPGSYDVWHEPPLIKTSLPDGTPLRASYYHAATVNDDQAMICPSEPRTVELLRDQARRMHAAWQAKGYMMSHDEIRVLNWCGACQKRNLDAGAILAANVKTCIDILHETNPGGRIYVWSDMFDPNHNAHPDYYLVRGDLSGSWFGLTPDVIIVPWYLGKAQESLRWFAQRGHKQLIAGYYDAAPAQVNKWLQAAQGVGGVLGVMYTTWQQKYSDLEAFSRQIDDFQGR